MPPTGRPFLKMSGSGNDFVVVDCRAEPPGDLASPDRVQAVCARGTGVGADGIVFLEPSAGASVKMTYLNADGSEGALCGNATLCVARLASEFEMGAEQDGLTIETGAGVLSARMAGGVPEIDLAPVTEVRADAPGVDLEPGERRIGFALAGVPHLVVRCEELAAVDVAGRGRYLRRHRTLAHGANVNFVAPAGSRPGGEPRRPTTALMTDAQGGARAWAIRTYERGVEAETLACGTGAVATAILLTVWGEASGDVELLPRSGRPLRVGLRATAEGWIPTLGGEARVVFKGVLSEV